MPQLEHNFSINPEIALEAIGVAYDLYQSPTSDYSTTIAEQVINGRPTAVFIPAVKFVIDASLHALAHPDEEAVASNSILRRGFRGKLVATEFTSVAIEFNLFGQMHQENPVLSKLSLDEVYIAGFKNKKVLRSLASAPFMDAAFISAGAFRLLQTRHGAQNDAADIIGRSQGLLAWAGIDKDNSQTAYNRFGPGYMNPIHLEHTVQDDDSTSVSYTATAKSRLKALYSDGGGCPFGKIEAATEAIEDAPLVNYWKQLVAYLIPENAVIS